MKNTIKNQFTKAIKANEINIPVGKLLLKGNLNVPSGAESIVIFSHGSGSSRFSLRNNYVADILNTEKIATLLIVLLTEREDSILENRFNIDLLTKRLIDVTTYIRYSPDLKNLTIGYFGASTGTASALNAAEQLDGMIHAVVSWGGRPDLAMGSLTEVKAHTLFIVGSLDDEVILLNEHAYSMLNCEKKLEIIEGASHLFEEQGKLNKIALLAANWFKKYLLKPQFKISCYSKTDMMQH